MWPLERYRSLIERLRQGMFRVQVACDPDQRNWWLEAGEANVATPRTVAELFALVDPAGPEQLEGNNAPQLGVTGAEDVAEGADPQLFEQLEFAEAAGAAVRRARRPALAIGGLRGGQQLARKQGDNQ